MQSPPSIEGEEPTEAQRFERRGLKVSGCSRCGGAHEGLPVRRFHRSIEPGIEGVFWFHWWATCPTTGDPILVGLLQPPGDDGILVSVTREEIEREWDR